MRQLFTAAFIISFLFPLSLHAQPGEVWSLQRSVQYALDHNISIQQNVLNERLSKLKLQQSQLSQIPNANINSSYGTSRGRSVDPTTNLFVDGVTYNFASANATADVLLFGWFQKRNTISQNKFSLDAANADLDQARDNVSLNVATGYLRALLAQEQIRVSEKQVALSAAQLEQTRRFAEAGRVPELDVAQMESQIASDSAKLITAISDYNNAILDIRALLNLDFTAPFALETPDIKVRDQVLVVSMTPESIYEEAKMNMGSVRGSMLRVSAAEKGLAASKSNLWPTLSLSGQLASNFASTDKSITGAEIVGSQVTPNYIDVSGNKLPVYQPIFNYTTANTPFWTQLENNFRQTVALNLNVPLFNGWQSQYTLKQAEINVFTQQLNKSQSELDLKQNVYKAYNDARNAIQKYNAADRAATAAQRAFDFAQKRYDLGLTNTVEYLTVQNTLYSSESQLASAKYDLIFKLKVIDYYLGKELKL